MATSAAKIIANRVNATNSTGPADTSRTRFNGLAHGLTSKQTVIPGESQQEYERFAAALRKDVKPGSAVENVLMDRLIAAAWRLQRFARVESAFLTNRIDAYMEAHPESDPDAAMANLFIDPAETAKMRLFMRYQTAVQREYDKAFKELQVQQLALGTDIAETADEPDFGFASHTSDEPLPANAGFASQSMAAAAA
jgi:hypothetical protein